MLTKRIGISQHSFLQNTCELFKFLYERSVRLPQIMRQTSRRYSNSSHSLLEKVTSARVIAISPVTKLLKVHWHGWYVHISFTNSQNESYTWLSYRAIRVVTKFNRHCLFVCLPPLK
jgi:hypothetical protein